MNKLSKNENGFGPIEILLTLILIAILVFVGFYIAHNSGGNKTTTNTSTTNTNTSSSTPNTTQKYFTISQWRVRAPYSGNLTLEYTPPSGNGGVYLSSVQLDNSDPQNCALNSPSGSTTGYGGYINRMIGSDQMTNDAGQSIGQTVQQYFNAYSNQIGYYMSHVGNYYYIYVHPQGSCGPNSMNIQTETDTAFENIVKSLQAY